MAPAPTDEDYRRLLRLPTGLRRFLRLSERQAKAAGLTPAQHQLLLAIRGHPDPRGPTLGDVAAYLLLRHHNAVGLVDRAEAAGLLVRRQDPDNLSIVRLRLTDEGSRQLEALSELHLEDPANPGVPDLPATHFLTNPKGSRTPVKHARLNAARYALERMVVDGIPGTPAPYTIVKFKPSPILDDARYGRVDEGSGSPAVAAP